MALNRIVVLLLNYCMVAFVASQELLDKDVEIISGKSRPEGSPLDAKFIGHYANDIYGPPVSSNVNFLCGT